ncbi:MAG: hypothetical protein KKD92_14070 [Proteobacteria bacterium]|nr:hypothetical protein [Pseudomonadota bacterium]
MIKNISKTITSGSGLNRLAIEEIAGEKISGEKGLWVAVLVNILNDLQAPTLDSKQEEAKRIVLQMEGCFNILAETFDLEPKILQKRIIKSLRRRGFELNPEKTKRW